MSELETQVTKIHLGNPKETSSYIFVIAEETPSRAEIYSIIELPILNPAAIQECDKIARAITATLRRIYKNTPDNSTFEHALSKINEELAKLSGSPQARWLHKLNALLGVKYKTSLSMTTVGKINAVLIREGNTSDLADVDNPIRDITKIFENFSSGKLYPEDIFLFSTPQFFNYISLERTHNLLRTLSLSDTALEIGRILKENAGPEIGFGTILAVQKNAERIPVTEPQVSSFTTPEPEETKPSILQILRHAIPLIKITNPFKKTTEATESSHSFWHVKELFRRDKSKIDKLNSGLEQTKTRLSISHWSWPKRFFALSSILLIIALGVNLFITKKITGPRSVNSASIEENFKRIQSELNDANAAIIFGDFSRATNLTMDAENLLNKLGAIPQESKSRADDLRKLLSDVKDKIEKLLQIDAKLILELPENASWTKAGSTLAALNQNTLTLINIKTNEATTSTITLNEPVRAVEVVSPTQLAIYTGSSLNIFNISNLELSPSYSQSVPTEQEFGGMSFYSNSKLYLINRSTKQLTSFQINDGHITKATTWATSESFSESSSLTIDGNIYILTKGKIEVWLQGKLTNTIELSISTQPTGPGKLLTFSTKGDIYWLDKDNCRIFILNKSGELQRQLVLNNINTCQDFFVDTSTQSALVISDKKLYSISLTDPGVAHK